MADIEKASAIDHETEAKKLRKHFVFTEADLMANQNGTLSEKQIQRIDKEERDGKKLGLIIGSALLVGSIVFIPLIFFWFSNLDQMKDIPGVWLLWAGFGVLFGLILLAMAGGGIYLIISQFMGKKQDTLQNVRGQARLVEGRTSRRNHVYYDLHINEQEFDGDGTINKIIIQDAEYIVYYLEGINEIMSVELISAPN